MLNEKAAKAGNESEEVTGENGGAGASEEAPPTKKESKQQVEGVCKRVNREVQDSIKKVKTIQDYQD